VTRKPSRWVVAGCRSTVSAGPVANPSAVLHVVATRAALAALGFRSRFALLLGKDLAVAELERSGLLDGVASPKSTAPAPTVLPSPATLALSPVAELDRATGPTRFRDPV